jgi:hypothetical protein
MDANTEYKYLAELPFLGDSVDYYAKATREQAARWLEAEQKEHAALRAAFDYEQRAKTFEQAQSAPVEKQAAAAEMFSHLEAFLGVWSRMSLLLFPQNERKDPRRAARATHLRTVLSVPTTHLLSNRALRNKWQHFDEALDDLAGSYRRSQLLIRSARFNSVARAESIRVLVVDKLSVEYAGVGSFDLEPMFEAGVEIGRRAHTAIQTWTDRHPLPGAKA